MKHLQHYSFLLIIVFTLFSCNNSNHSKHNAPNKESISESNNTGKIKVYYFHTNYRCNTCSAVENSTGEYLKLLFPEVMKNQLLTYKVINIEEIENQGLVKKYQVAGQKLLFIRDNKVIDKTSDAFMNATTNPDMWKSIVKQTVEELLTN